MTGKEKYRGPRAVLGLEIFSLPSIDFLPREAVLREEIGKDFQRAGIRRRHGFASDDFFREFKRVLLHAEHSQIQR